MTGSLISTIEAPGEFDALSKLRPGEPYFALIGRDRYAPPLVMLWAERNRVRALKDFREGRIDEEQRNRELAKSAQAEETAWAMADFKSGAVRDADGETQIASYTGHELDEDTKQRDELQRRQNRTAAMIGNLLAELVPLLDLQEEIGPRGSDLMRGRRLVADLQDFAERITPKRPGMPTNG